MRLTGDGNVGIGTSSPEAKLEVLQNTLGTTAGNSANIVKFGGDSGGPGALLLTSERVSNGSDWTTTGLRLQKIVDSTKMGYIQFGDNGSTVGGLIFGNSDATERMRIMPDGKVGIGTNAPGAQLQIGPQDNDHLFLASTANTYGWMIDTDDQGSGTVPFRIKRRVAGTDTLALTIANANGNVGIGTDAPSDSIHLYKAANEQTTGLLIEKANGGTGSANAFFCVASNSGEANYVSVPKAGIMFERTAQYGLGKLKLCVDSSNDTNPVGVSDSLICLLNNTHLGFGPNLTPSQRFHFQWSTEADHMYMQFGGVTHDATSAYWKPYFYTPGNTSNSQSAGGTYYSNNMFFGCGQFEVGWGSNYYGGSITIRAGNVRAVGNNGTASSTNYYSGHVYLDGGVSTTGGSISGASKTYGGSIIFRCQNIDTGANTDQNYYERMRVDGSTGNVGIGNAAPPENLTVEDVGIQPTFGLRRRTYADYAVYMKNTTGNFDTVTTSDDTVLNVGKGSGSDRSINALGTINASGSDYAEYMKKSRSDLVIKKGDIVGINNDGELTNVFSESIQFVVKSTDPSYVGGDSWKQGTVNTPKYPSVLLRVDEYSNISSQDANLYSYWEEQNLYANTKQLNVFYEENEKYLEDKNLHRNPYDRIAYCGQVPVNIYDAQPGQYVIPKQTEDDRISYELTITPTFDQYKLSIGKVIKIQEDGRAFMIVNVS
jgi:hypothetical protein